MTSMAGMPDASLFYEPYVADQDGPDEGAATTDSVPFALTNRMGAPNSIVSQPAEATRSSMHSDAGDRDTGHSRAIRNSTTSLDGSSPPQIVPTRLGSLQTPARGESPPLSEKKMHQTSTRIMKVTPEGRPFTRVGLHTI
jgi:hypothetical protein